MNAATKSAVLIPLCLFCISFKSTIMFDNSHTGRLAKRLTLLHAAGSDNVASVIELLPKASRSTFEMVLRIAAQEDALQVVTHMLKHHHKKYDDFILMRSLNVAAEFDAPRVVNHLLHNCNINWDEKTIKHALDWSRPPRAPLTNKLLQTYYNNLLSETPSVTPPETSQETSGQ